MSARGATYRAFGFKRYLVCFVRALQPSFAVSGVGLPGRVHCRGKQREEGDCSQEMRRTCSNRRSLPCGRPRSESPFERGTWTTLRFLNACFPCKCLSTHDATAAGCWEAKPYARTARRHARSPIDKTYQGSGGCLHVAKYSHHIHLFIGVSCYPSPPQLPPKGDHDHVERA
jgi:hypothetical protein